jgi:hypothetical protein
VPVSTLADSLNDPVLQVDQESRTLHVFASRHGTIVSKEASLDDLRFEPGTGHVFMVGGSGAVANPTSSKDPVDSRSGMVILASDTTGNAYRHAEAPIESRPGQVQPSGDPPAPPEQLRAEAIDPDTVTLTWQEVVDPNRWRPGEDGERAAGYVVSRDGVEIATVTEPYLRDQVVDGSTAARPASLEYAVQAFDLSGNRSEPSTAVVDLPLADPGSRTPWLLVGLVAAGAVAVIVVRRRPPASGRR